MSVFSFYGEDAQKYGVNCAVILYDFRQGRNAWVRYPVRAVVAGYPWLTEPMARGCLHKLVDAGALEVERRGGNLDRTLSYRLRNNPKLNTVVEQTHEVSR